MLTPDNYDPDADINIVDPEVIDQQARPITALVIQGHRQEALKHLATICIENSSPHYAILVAEHVVSLVSRFVIFGTEPRSWLRGHALSGLTEFIEDANALAHTYGLVQVKDDPRSNHHPSART